MRIFRHHIQLPIVLLILLEAAVAAFALWFVRGLQLPLIFPVPGTRVLDTDLVAFAGLLVLMQSAMGLYNPRLRAGRVGIALRMMLAATATLMILWISALLLPEFEISPTHFALALVLTIAGNSVVRLGFDYLLPLDLFKSRVLVYGAGRQSESISGLRRRTDRTGFQVVGYVKTPGDTAIRKDATLVVQGQLLDFCRAHDVDEIVVAMDDRRRAFPLQELLQCRMHGIDVIELLSFLEREAGKVPIDVLHPSWMIFSEGFRRSAWRRAVDSTLDLLAGTLLIAVSWPIMLLTIITIKMEDGWRAPVLYRQRRVGWMGREFDLLKFRSMNVDAESDGVARWAARDDSRITWVGRLIRQLRVDELPQIFNVLKGEMRLVGPRPERPEFVAELSQEVPYYSERHAVAPGLTGWAQLCYPYGSSHTDAAEKLQYDLYYIKYRSVLFDIAILVQTVEIVLFGKGAR